MKTTSRSIFALLMGASIWMTGCFDDLKTDTSNLVGSVARLEENTARMADSIENINQTAASALTSMDNRIGQFETLFQQAVEQMAIMAQSVSKLDDLLELLDYIESMAISLEKVSQSVKNFEQLAEEVKPFLKTLGVTLHDEEDSFENIFGDE